nr:hypothetical protein [Phycicoccus sp. HDW14]
MAWVSDSGFLKNRVAVTTGTVARTRATTGMSSGAGIRRPCSWWRMTVSWSPRLAASDSCV